MIEDSETEVVNRTENESVRVRMTSSPLSPKPSALYVLAGIMLQFIFAAARAAAEMGV